MADTIPDIAVPSTSWVNVYTATSISAATSVILQSKGSAPILIYTAASAPSVSSTDGFVINTYESAVVDGAPAGIWVRSVAENGLSGKLHVETL